MSNKSVKAILLGYSGHGHVVAEAALLQGIAIIGYADPVEHSQNPYQLDFLGDERSNQFNWHTCEYYLLGVGSNLLRASLANRVRKKGGYCVRVIHPSASIAPTTQTGQGSFIARNVAVNPMVQIGDNVILNTSCVIDHECRIGNNVHIAPGAVLAGNVKVGDGAFVGANSVVKEGVSIGKHALIGAGSVVINDVADYQIVVGNPAKEKGK